MAKMKRIVITGPTGAIGVAIVKYMIEQGIYVLAICNPTSKRIDRLPKSKYLRIVKCSLDDLKELCIDDEEPYDVFYHLGWEGTTGSARNDVFLQTKNVKNCLDAVCLAKRLGCHTFIGAGSQAEYGRVEGKLKPDTPVHPENGYGMAKLSAGLLSRLQCQNIGIRQIWMRVLSVYGPYDGENSMVMSTMRRLIKGESPNTTKGEQLWDYLYSGDAAKAFYLAGLKGKDGAIYCLGSGQAYPLKEYVKNIQKIVNENVEVNYGAIPYAEDQLMYLCADISELKYDVGFEPEVSFKEGIRRTLCWYKGDKNEKD